jgi:hypothetical protein
MNRHQLIAAVTLVTPTLCCAEAAADASAWFHSGGGVLAWKGGPEDSDTGADIQLSPALAFDLGVGTSEQAPFIFGGYFKLQPILGHGTDVAVMARFATLGFQQDWIGVAFDAGLLQRWWGPESTGFLGQAVLGLPLGLQLTAMGTGGSNSTFGFGGTLGLDLVRLTVSRKNLLDWWPNPRASDAMYETSISGPRW